MTTKLELQQALNRVNAELVELRHKTAEQAQTIEDARTHYANMRNKYEEQKRWATLYESKWRAAERKLANKEFANA